jgi:hypothetical protein
MAVSSRRTLNEFVSIDPWLMSGDNPADLSVTWFILCNLVLAMIIADESPLKLEMSDNWPQDVLWLPIKYLN